MKDERKAGEGNEISESQILDVQFFGAGVSPEILVLGEQMQAHHERMLHHLEDLGARVRRVPVLEAEPALLPFEALHRPRLGGILADVDHRRLGRRVAFVGVPEIAHLATQDEKTEETPAASTPLSEESRRQLAAAAAKRERKRRG